MAIPTLQDAQSCTAPGVGAPGTFSVAAIPAGVGAACSCQRTASACIETYGAACATLACSAEGAVRSESTCTDVGRLAGRCVTRDGQAEYVFYSPPITSATAETTCHAATSTEAYWFPDGIGAP